MILVEHKLHGLCHQIHPTRQPFHFFVVPQPRTQYPTKGGEKKALTTPSIPASLEHTGMMLFAEVAISSGLVVVVVVIVVIVSPKSGLQASAFPSCDSTSWAESITLLAMPAIFRESLPSFILGCSMEPLYAIPPLTTSHFNFILSGVYPSFGSMLVFYFVVRFVLLETLLSEVSLCMVCAGYEKLRL